MGTTATFVLVGVGGLRVGRLKGKRASKRRRRRTKMMPYTRGELNKLIDGVCHPLCESDKRFFLLDGLLHAFVERDVHESVRKFVKYNVPVILKELSEKR